MNLRSLLLDILNEVSSRIISFQIRLHLLRVQIYRIFEDMHQGITDTLESMNYEKNNTVKFSFRIDKFRKHPQK